MSDLAASPQTDQPVPSAVPRAPETGDIDIELLLDQAQALARQYIDHRSPVAIALARQMMLRNAAALHPRQAHAVESLAMLHTSRNDGREGVASFNEKRPPEYTGRASDGMPGFYPWW